MTFRKVRASFNTKNPEKRPLFEKIAAERHCGTLIETMSDEFGN